jgi:hypothetical protein
VLFWQREVADDNESFPPLKKGGRGDLGGNHNVCARFIPLQLKFFIPSNHPLIAAIDRNLRTGSF